MNSADLTFWLAFGAGFLSFISPCCLPLYPSYLSYITGVSVKDIRDGKGMFQRQALLHTVFFMIGFSVIFIVLGLSASFLGDLFSANRDLIRKLGALLVMVMGLVMMGIFHPEWLLRERRFQFQSRTGRLHRIRAGGDHLCRRVDAVRGADSSGHTGDGSLQSRSGGMAYIMAYTAGFAIPFFIMAFFIGKIKWILKYSSIMMKAGGALMILTGILLYTDQMTKITTFLIQIYGGFSGF